jgi:hypothetical protein
MVERAARVVAAKQLRSSLWKTPLRDFLSVDGPNYNEMWQLPQKCQTYAAF